MISSGINLVMTVIGFAVSTMFIVFVCTRLICARIQLRASRRSFPAASRSDLSVLERGLHGLEPAVVASFPTKKFSDQFFSSRQQTQCTICLAEYQEKDVLRILPYCGHAFHVTCIDIWLKQHSTCPMCRISLRESPDRRRTMQPAHSAAIRSLYSQESFDLDSYHSLHEGHPNHHLTEPTLEGQLISEPSGQRESGSVEVDCSSKFVGHHDPQGKYMESPSDS